VKKLVLMGNGTIRDLKKLKFGVLRNFLFLTMEFCIRFTQNVALILVIIIDI
jgi:hypothetical protein